MDKKQSRNASAPVSRRAFLSKGAAGVSAAALAGVGEAQAQVKWDLSADVVVIGAGVSGLSAAITARDAGALVISVEENFDIGGRGMLSGGRVHLGGGHALQQKFGIKDSADQVFKDWVRHDSMVARYSDRDLVRVFADENVASFNFLIDNGVEFIENRSARKPPPRCRALSSRSNGRTRTRSMHRAAVATAPDWCGGWSRAHAARACRSCCATR